jgi:hypothetical protein
MTFWKIRGKNGSGSLSMVDAFFCPGLAFGDRVRGVRVVARRLREGRAPEPLARKLTLSLQVSLNLLCCSKAGCACGVRRRGFVWSQHRGTEFRK